MREQWPEEPSRRIRNAWQIPVLSSAPIWFDEPPLSPKKAIKIPVGQRIFLIFAAPRLHSRTCVAFAQSRGQSAGALGFSARGGSETGVQRLTWEVVKGWPNSSSVKLQ